MQRTTSRKRSFAGTDDSPTSLSTRGEAQQPALKKNKYFQSAVADPSKKVDRMFTAIIPAPAEVPAPTIEPTPTPTRKPIPTALNITVGLAPDQRTWCLSVTPLAKYSTYFARLTSNNPQLTTHELSDVNHHAFANFVDYIHSGIYSPNTRVPGFRYLRTGAEAALLGFKLGCTEYRDVGTRKLYQLFEPLARLKQSNKAKSLIRASDVEWICELTRHEPDVKDTETPPQAFFNDLNRAESTTGANGIRQLFFDAVASHWTQREVGNMVNETELGGDTVTWGHVYTTYHEFRETMEKSLNDHDLDRAALLRPVEEYFRGGGKKEKGRAEKKEEGDGEGLRMRTVRRRRLANQVRRRPRSMEDEENVWV